MAKVRQHDGDLYVSGNLRVLGGIQNVKNSETVTRLATSEAAITVVEGTLTEAVEDIATIEVRPLFVTVYKRSVAYPDAPVGVTHTGWSIDIPTGTDPIYMSGAQVSFDGTALIGSWYTPVRFTNAATLAAILTNETHRVPTDIDGNFGSYASAETKLEIYEGSVYVSGEFTMGYTASAGVTVDTAYFTSTKVVHVTDMSVDDGYVDLSGVRAGTTITKRFSITKSKQGDAAPSYSISASTVVALVKPDGTINPPVINMSATYQVGTTPPQPFEAVFRFLVNGVEQFVPKTKQSLYAWSGFGDILIDNVSEILLYNTPDIILPFNYSGQDALAYMTVEIWSPKVGSVPGEWLPDVLLDSQSVTFIADWENYREDMLGEVPDFVPRYLGRFNSVMPTEYRKGDSWLVYDTDDQPYERGLYLYNGTDAPYRLTDAVGSTSGLIVEAMPDILWAVKNGYGDTAQYGAVTYIENLVSNAIFTNHIQIGQGNVADLDTTLSDLEAAAALDATAKANAAKVAAEAAAALDATTKAELAELTASAYADGIVSDEEARAIADATAKANAAQAAAEAAAALDATAKANAVAGIVPRYRGQLATAPSADLRAGDYYYNTADFITYAYTGSAWQAYSAGTAYANAAALQAKTDARNDTAVKLGYASWADMEAKAALGQTVIDGGYIRTNLIKIGEDTLIADGAIQTKFIKASELQVGKLLVDPDGIVGSGFEAQIDGDVGVKLSFNSELIMSVNKDTGAAVFKGAVDITGGIITTAIQSGPLQTMLSTYPYTKIDTSIVMSSSTVPSSTTLEAWIDSILATGIPEGVWLDGNVSYGSTPGTVYKVFDSFNKFLWKSSIAVEYPVYWIDRVLNNRAVYQNSSGGTIYTLGWSTLRLDTTLIPENHIYVRGLTTSIPSETGRLYIASDGTVKVKL